MPRYIHSHTLVPWELLYHATIYPLPHSSSMGVIISCHDISTPTFYFHGSYYIKPRYIHPHPHVGLIIRTLYFHSGENLMRGWINRDIISPLTIFSEEVNISWHYIFTPDNIWWGGEYIVTLYFHPWQYLVRGWIYRDIIFSPLTIFGEGVNISWHYIFTPDNIWWGGEYIVTLCFHPWQYLVRGWIYRDIIFSPLTIFGEGVNISWHYVFTPDNIWWGGEYIVTLCFHPWQYLVRGWIYRDIIFSPLTIFGEGVNISWHYIFTPDNIWWGGEYIVTLYFHPWQYLVSGWWYNDIEISFLTLP